MCGSSVLGRKNLGKVGVKIAQSTLAFQPPRWSCEVLCIAAWVLWSFVEQTGIASSVLRPTYSCSTLWNLPWRLWVVLKCSGMSWWIALQNLLLLLQAGTCLAASFSARCNPVFVLGVFLTWSFGRKMVVIFIWSWVLTLKRFCMRGCGLSHVQVAWLSGKKNSHLLQQCQVWLGLRFVLQEC